MIKDTVFLFQTINGEIGEYEGGNQSKTAPALMMDQDGNGRKVVIKERLPIDETDPNSSVVSYFFNREVRILENFPTESKYLPEVIFVDEEAGFIVLEQIEGERLQDWINRTRHEHSSQKMHRFIRILDDLVEGFEEMYKILLPEEDRTPNSQTALSHHGDFKPENVVFDTKGKAYLIDFSLAGFQSKDNHLLPGTIFYMSYEAAFAEVMDQRNDVYQIGVMIYRYFSEGKHPIIDNFSDIVTVLNDLNTKSYTPLAIKQLIKISGMDISDEDGLAINRVLEKSVARMQNRYKTPRVFIEDLKKIIK